MVQSARLTRLVEGPEPTGRPLRDLWEAFEWPFKGFLNSLNSLLHPSKNLFRDL